MNRKLGWLLLAAAMMALGSSPCHAGRTRPGLLVAQAAAQGPAAGTSETGHSFEAANIRQRRYLLALIVVLLAVGAVYWLKCRRRLG